MKSCRVGTGRRKEVFSSKKEMLGGMVVGCSTAGRSSTGAGGRNKKAKEAAFPGGGKTSFNPNLNYLVWLDGSGSGNIG
jgi:hypothetical protein